MIQPRENTDGLVTDLKLNQKMAQWVNYTKKLLTSAVTHLADELEQTVLDFNEAIHNLSSSQVAQERNDSVPADSSIAEDESTVITEPVQNTLKTLSESHSNDSTVLPYKEIENEVHSNVFKASNSFCDENQKNIFIQSYHVTTTRQPETSGFTSVVTATLSKSPSIPGDVVRLQQSCQVHYVAPLPPDTHQSCGPQTASRCDHRNVEQRFPTQLCKSPVSEVIARDCVKQNPVLGMQGNSQCKLQSISAKRPGKVIRAQVASFYDEGHLDSHRHFVPILDGTFEMDSGSNRDDQDGDGNTNTVLHTKVNVIVERVSHSLNWLSPLSSISRVLSFALSHVASMLLVMDDESHPLEHEHCPTSRQLSVTYHHHNLPIRESFDFTAGHTYQIIRDNSPHEPPSPSLIRSTQSCESFEIIEQPTDQDFEHCSEYVGQRPLLLRMFSQSNSNGETPDPLNITDAHFSQADPCSSSAEFCNFDFKNLVSNKHFNQLNPFPGEFEPKSHVCNNGTPMVTGILKDTINSLTDSVCVNEEDLEDNKSDSFTVISENDEDDFIILQLTN